jgi:hypothetical protein
MYTLLADALVIIHCAYVGYVVLGQLAIWLGWAFRWRWTRHFWFRVTHLAAIGFVAFEEGIGMACPLTVWEADFREMAGESVRSGTFMGRLFHDLLFLDLPHWAFTWIHVGFAALVLATFLLYPPKLPAWWRRRPSSKAI